VLPRNRDAGLNKPKVSGTSQRGGYEAKEDCSRFALLTAVEDLDDARFSWRLEKEESYHSMPRRAFIPAW